MSSFPPRNEKAFSYAIPEEASQPSKKSRVFRRLAIFLGLTWVVLAGFRHHSSYVSGSGCSVKSFLPSLNYESDKDWDWDFSAGGRFQNQEALCPQASALVPQKNKEIWEKLATKFETEEWKAKAREGLAGAVRVPSESYDNMPGPGEDPRWEIFGELHDYLEKAFPLVHSTLSLTKVNTYGLLYEWTGSNPSLKPLLLAAHQDVVPVDPKTVSEWTHPPYSGHFDGTYIWGRGSSDDKSGLVGILTAIESMLEAGWTPERTVVLAFGFDEEASGHHGAKALGKKMEEVYGEGAFAFIVDEGGGFSQLYGTSFATPGIAEKGYIDVRIDVATPGGHSSVPPPHTTIGILSQLVVAIESNPYPAQLTRSSVLYSSMQCYASHGVSMDSRLKRTIEKSVKSDRALKKLEKTLFEEPATKALVGTTQAVDLVLGGVKANALPEQAYAVVNHRIDTASSVEEVMKRDTETIQKWMKTFNLSLEAFGEEVVLDRKEKKKKKAYYGSVVLTDAFGNHLAPAPVTPTGGEEAKPYEILSGTIRGTFNAFRNVKSLGTGGSKRLEEEIAVEEGGIAVAPGMPTGNTDTRYYWALSEHIFRYNHKNSRIGTNRLANGIHTVNENMEVEAFYEMVWFFETLILNTDEATSV
ncbi:carboxypeptidase S [Dendrothele bispora CBS 962.96]|uniref:Carboxypeptidase S n=1 Tax=Dendrothele bispora (strain CBS 962.96) TaxID=1314807 RepID=A0A4V4HGJ5_DENBC|nr:carboxypeptidase S [Dendrothele bispora CBS 962.96]